MSSNIFFQPFVGKDYANGGIFGKRIMILARVIIVMRVVRIVATASYIGSV